MTNSTQLNIRLNEEVRTQLERVGAHLGKTPAGVVRFLLRRADAEIAGGATITIPPVEIACEKLRVSEDELRQLIAVGRLSDPPTHEEVDRWTSDATLASPRDILARLARTRRSSRRA